MKEVDNETFLEWWFYGCDIGDKLRVMAGYQNSPQLAFDDPVKAYQYSKEKEYQFFSVCASDPEAGQGTDASAVWLPGLVADLDYGDKGKGKAYLKTEEDALEFIRALPLPPNGVVNSGKGFHLYWKTNPVITAQDYPELPTRWSEYLGDLAAAVGAEVDRNSLNRNLRVPGSKNQKYGVYCDVVETGERFYRLQEFAPFIDIRPGKRAQVSCQGVVVRDGLTPPEEKLEEILEDPVFLRHWNNLDGDLSAARWGAGLRAVEMGWEAQEVTALIVMMEETRLGPVRGEVKLKGLDREIDKLYHEFEKHGGKLVPTTSAEVIERLDGIPKDEWTTKGLALLAGKDLLVAPQLSNSERAKVLNHIKRETKVPVGDLRADLAIYQKEQAQEKGITCPAYIRQYNERFLYWEGGGAGGIYELYKGRIIEHTREGFKALTANDPLEGSDLTKGEAWLTHKNRRAIREEVCDPRLAPLTVNEDQLNVWEGWAYEPDESKDCSLFWDRVLVDVCDGHDGNYKYVRKYMAHAIQRTWELPKTAIAMTGKKGTGKSMVGQVLGRLFKGRSMYYETSSLQDLTKEINHQRGTAVVIVGDDITWGGNREYDSYLKKFITGPTKEVRRMYKDGVAARNMSRVFLSTNGEWVINTGKDERRYLVLETNNEHSGKGMHAYWSPVFEQLEQGGYERLMWDLLEEELEGWEPTLFEGCCMSGLHNQIEESLTGLPAYLMDALEDWPFSKYAFEDGWNIPKWVLYEDYKGWHSHHRHEKLLSKRMFGTRMNYIVGKAESTVFEGGKTVGSRRLPNLTELAHLLEGHIMGSL